MISASSPLFLVNYGVIRELLDPQGEYLSDEEILKSLKVSGNYLQLSMRKCAFVVYGKAFKAKDRKMVRGMSALLSKIGTIAINSTEQKRKELGL